MLTTADHLRLKDSQLPSLMRICYNLLITQGMQLSYDSNINSYSRLCACLGSVCECMCVLSFFSHTKKCVSFLFLLHPLLLYNNFFLLLLLMGRLFGLDLSLLLPKDPFNVYSKAKSFQSLVFISNSLGQFLLPLLLNVILVHQRNKYVPLDVNLHYLQVYNTEVLLSSDEAALVDNGLLGVIIHSFEDMEDLVFQKNFVDEVGIVDVIQSSQSLHIPQDVDLDCV